MACTGICAVVSNNMTYDCNNKAIGGIVQTVKLINRCDIDPTEWTVTRAPVPPATGCANLITSSATDPGTMAAITVQGIPGKRLLDFGFTTTNTDFGTYFTHTVNLFAQGLSQQTLCNIKDFANGAEVIAIVEQNFKGVDKASAFVVLGWDAGLKIADMAFAVNENNGNSIIPLSSLDPDLEPYPPLTFLKTDYATTKAWFDSLG
jgi:hypothetical protein